MPCQQLGSAFGDRCELRLERFRNARMDRSTLVAQQGAIGGVLHQRMIELVDRIRRDTLTKQQTGTNQPLQRGVEFGLLFARHGGEQYMREFPADRRPDLRQRLGRAQPVQARHQRRVQ